jgi:urate oxidase
MSFTLGHNRYGKAENHVVRVVRDTDRHEVRDLTVGVSLSGDLAAAHLTGDNAHVLPTDTQKNTVFAFAKEYGISSPEAFGLLLARHFVTSRPAIRYARIALTEALWQRLTIGGVEALHSFSRNGSETRTALVTYDGARARVISGLSDLVVMNSTDSQFRGFDTDRYTTLPEAGDRVLATSVTARWRFAGDPAAADAVEVDALDRHAVDWDAGYAQTRADLLTAFVTTSPSLSLQQTLFQMGGLALEHRPELDEVRLAMPNKHHFTADLSAFGLENPNEVFYAADRPYGLIEGTVRRGPGGADEVVDEGQLGLTVAERDQDW